jgi:hypothetical protein
MKDCNHATCQGKCRRPPRKKPIRKSISRFSKKREKENRKYSTLRKRFLEEGDECEAKLPGCTFFATELHHPAGRVGKNLLEVKKCKKVCRNCHQRIELRPNEAKQLGLSESRLTCGNEKL